MSNQRKKLIAGDEAILFDTQHKSPCSDCPWRQNSLKGWLNGELPDAWLADVHGEQRIDCHVLIGPQCAGAAIYRGNICKHPRQKDLLVLPPDRVKVFGSPMEFKKHHETTGISDETEEQDQ